jgi:hypothetical protein
MALVKYNNNSLSAITSVASMPSGAMTLIKSQTASSSSTISFVDGTSDVVLDSTYPIYLFTFNNIHPATNQQMLTFNMSIDSGSNYNIAKTTTFFNPSHAENDAGGELNYDTGKDLAQGTGFQNITRQIGSDNDNSGSGYLYLFSPSSTVFIKHFIATSNSLYNYDTDYTMNAYVAGYGNTTSAVDAIQFKMASGNIDAGTIKLYGIKDS